MAAEPSERAVLRNLQKEQERERRRIRDRERRQSMTAEEREKHLARRRRNYQLRRQRAAGANLLPERNRTPMLPIPSHEHQAAVVPIPVVHLQTDVAVSDASSPQCSYPGQEISIAGFEVQSCAIDKLPGKSRLNHIKQLARSLADTADAQDANPGVVVAAAAAADSVVKADAVPFPIGAQQKSLRLNHVKRLARASTCAVKAAQSQDQATERKVQQDPSGGELQPAASPISQLCIDQVTDERLLQL